MQQGTVWMWARISVLIFCVRIKKMRVRIKIDGCGWLQGLEDWALLMALVIQMIIYSSTQSSTFGNFTWVLRSFRHFEELSHRFA